MICLAKAASAVVLMGALACAQNAQPPAPVSNAPDNKAGAYYNFAMGRLYAELAATEGNKGDNVAKAVQHYQEALKLDPSANIIFEELTDLYIQTNRLRDAVTQAEEMLKKSPENLNARRMLGRIYMRMLGDNSAGKINEEYLKQAIDQFQKITEKEPKDAESWTMLARLYRVSNKSPEAEKAYNNALQADPENEDALTGLALMYAELGDSKRAIEKLKAITDKSPNERLLAILADQYEQLRDFKSAAEVLRKAYELAPDNGRIARGLAKDLLYSEQLDEALKLYEQLTVEEPRDPQLPLSIAEIHRAKHDLVKAREWFNKAKAIDGENLEVRYEEVKLLEAENKNDQALTTLKAMLDDTARRTYTEAEGRARATMLEEYGILSRSQQKYPQALDAFKQMAALPGDAGPRAIVQTIDTYRQSKDYASAMKESEAALKKYPNERMLKVEHATVLSDTGKIDEAAAEMRTLLGGDRDRETYLSLAQIFEKGKRYTDMGKALDEAEKLSKTNEDQEGVHFMRGAMLERMKRFDAAEAEFRKVIELNPNNASALNYLGYMLADRNVRLDEAFSLVKKALELDPDNGAYLDSIGWVYYRQGKLTEAERALVRALDTIGQDGTVHDHLGDVYFKLGKTKEAITQWQASLRDHHAAAEADPAEVAKVSKKLDEARVRLAQETKKK
jgi:tetratricopeptide (TPR) repeat protein